MAAQKRPDQLDSPILPVVFRHVGRAQVWIYRKTGGRIGGKWRIGAGFRKPVPTLLLEHRGRKDLQDPGRHQSGKTFTVPLLFVRDGDDVVIVASQGGRLENPQWYHNLVAAPDVHVQIGPRRSAVLAVVAESEERARLWPKLVDAYADFDTYQSWTEREIPVVVLKPR